MYHPTTRVLAVLALLRAHQRMTGVELARRLEVDARTLRRYITMLQDLGIPILSERGRYGAYYLDASFKLPPLMFTNDEALALAIGLLAAQRIDLAAMAHAVESARAKLELVMPPDLQHHLRALTESIALDLERGQISPSSENLRILSSAVQWGRRVSMHYRSGQGDETERHFDPYGLAYHMGKWYAVGYCALRQDLRSFRLDRILNVNLTDDHFERPLQFDALAHVVRDVATLPRQFTFEIFLKTDLFTAQKEISAVMGILEAVGEGVMFWGSVADLDGLARQLAGYSFDFVVHEPDQLRVALRKRAVELAALADAR